MRRQSRGTTYPFSAVRTAHDGKMDDDAVLAEAEMRSSTVVLGVDLL